MTVTGVNEVTGRLEAFIESAKTVRGERAMTEFLIAAGAQAAALTPIDTSNLINSQGRDIQPLRDGWRGVIYYGAKYAPYVHEADASMRGMERTGRFSSGNYWDPDAEPGFLRKGVERAKREDLPGILRRNYGV